MSLCRCFRLCLSWCFRLGLSWCFRLGRSWCFRLCLSWSFRLSLSLCGLCSLSGLCSLCGLCGLSSLCGLSCMRSCLGLCLSYGLGLCLGCCLSCCSCVSLCGFSELALLINQCLLHFLTDLGHNGLYVKSCATTTATSAIAGALCSGSLLRLIPVELERLLVLLQLFNGVVHGLDQGCQLDLLFAQIIDLALHSVVSNFREGLLRSGSALSYGRCGRPASGDLACHVVFTFTCWGAS